MRYSCQPVSRRQLRMLSRSIRETEGLSSELWFPAIKFLEMLHKIIGDEDFYPEIVPDDKWDQPPTIHAYFDLNDNCIRVKESIYLGACNGVGRDRMTIVHECAHVILIKRCHLKLTRSFDDNVPVYRDPEWQAKCLAGELMVPADLVCGMSDLEVAEKCGVSVEAARYQLSRYPKRKSGQARNLTADQ